MLVLTAAAYKMAVGGRLPAVAYLTLLDKYMLMNSLFVVLCAVRSQPLPSSRRGLPRGLSRRTSVAALALRRLALPVC